MKKNNQSKPLIFIFIVFIVFVWVAQSIQNKKIDMPKSLNNSKSFNILASYDNEFIEDSIVKFSKKKRKAINVTYMGDLEIVDELNQNAIKYDAVLISNSMWLYMLNNSSLIKDSKSLSISPIVFGIKKEKAKELELIGKDTTNKEILNLIKDKMINYVMPSVTKTNTGATAYIGFLNSLAGNPEILSDEILNDDKLIKDLKDLFSGVQRVSGDESFLEEMFIKSDKYDSVIASEASLININIELQKQKKDELYFLYPVDGLAVNDTTFAFINNDLKKETFFLNLQQFLLSDDGQKTLEENGYRTWYGGVNTNVDNSIFNKDWGVDTSKYLNVTKFPPKKMISKSINLYIEEMRKPSHTVFCLDYSGSMSGNGIVDLNNAITYLLDYEKAAKDMIQFSKNDKITIIPFSTKVQNVWHATGHTTDALIRKINLTTANGSTALYAAVNEGLSILNAESDEYTKTIVAMTDGLANVGTFNDVSYFYNRNKLDIPIYSITFGNASEYQLKELANLSNAKIFDGKANLLRAFKEVRGYN